MKEITVNFISLYNFNWESDITKANEAKELIVNVINKDSFRNKVIEAVYKDRRFKGSTGAIIQLENNDAILQVLLEGNEYTANEGVDYQWDFKISLYTSWTGEIGHTKGGDIFTKKEKFRKMSKEEVAAHWIHEYCHTIGFIHDFKDTAKRKYSIPYVVGDIAANILKTTNI